MNDLNLSQLDEGIDALIENASALVKEASLLHEHKHYSRAYTLAHLAREEVSKVTMLFAAGVRIVAGHPVDWKKLRSRFVSHKSKLMQDTLWGFMSTGLAQTEEAPQILGVLSASADGRNDAKNNSLYVGFKDGSFLSPSDAISEKTAARTVELARMAVDEWVVQRRLTPRLADRAPGSMKEQFQHVPQIDLSTPDAILNAARTGSVLMEMVREAQRTRAEVNPKDKDKKD